MIRARYLSSMDDITSVLEIRRAVFERSPGAAARDAFDDMAVYALAFDEADAPSAAGRLYIDADDRFRIDAVGVLAPLRARGYGDLVMRMLLDRALTLGAPAVYADSFPCAVGFYARYGLRPVMDTPVSDGALVPLCASADQIALEGSCGGRHGCPGRTP
ncbi:MAG: GNAT family N-acetyltransferase, partial [Christensenellaceae bacterium]|nr:GNAT family N-acetyltransferase [Christensenellaceae bacterium]